MKFADRITQVKPSLTLAITQRAKEMKKKGIDVVSFGAGEPDFDTPEAVKEAGIRAIQEGFTKYTPASGTPELKKAVCAKLKTDNGLQYSPAQVVISCGAKHTLYNIFQVICDRGDEVVIIAPYWVSYPEMVKLSGATPRIIATDEKTGFVPKADDIKKAITKRTKAIIVNSPSNPTGAVLSKKVLSEIADIAVSKKIHVISDEIYEKLIYDGEAHESIGALNEKIYDLTFTVNGLSKSHSMTGWRIGYAAGPEKAMKHISALQSHSTSNPASVSQKAALEALKSGDTETEKMRRAFKERRDYMVKRINGFEKMSCVNPGGAFYCFANIGKTGLKSLEIAEKLLEEVSVAVVPGIAFGSDEHVRLSFATSMDTIKKGLDRIEEWLKK